MAADCHFHVFAANEGLAGARYRPAYAAPLTTWSSLAATSGIARGVLVQTSFMGTDNHALLQTLAQAPDRLRGIAVLDPASGASQVDALHAQGVRGLRLNLVGRDHDVSAWVAAGHALWEAMQRLGWHLLVHTDIGLLPGVLRQLPAGLPLVFDHFARPASASAHDVTVRSVASRAAKAPVHIKLSAPYRLGGVDAAALARLWLAELGANRLLWGSDWPCTNHETHADYPALARSLERWMEDPALVHQVRVLNPARLYWP